MSAPRWMFVDCEGTGVDPYNDRIVELCVMEAVDGKIVGRLAVRVNPGRPIPPEASEVHGIRDEDVARLPTFEHHAKVVQQLVNGSVLVGYALRRYDSPLIDAELRRAGQPGLEHDANGRICHPEIDAFEIWRRSEQRTLAAAAKRFAGQDLTGAHSASSDTAVLGPVIKGMIQAFGIEPSLGALIELSKREGEIDRDGKFVLINDVPCFNIGDPKGRPVWSDTGFLEWMLKKDFSPDTLSYARQFLDEAYGQGRLSV